MVMLEKLLNTGNCICVLSNAASSTVAKRVLTSGCFVHFCLLTVVCRLPKIKLGEFE